MAFNNASPLSWLGGQIVKFVDVARAPPTPTGPALQMVGLYSSATGDMFDPANTSNTPQTVSSNQLAISNNLTVNTTAAYTTGQVVGGLMNLVSMSRSNNGSGFLQSVIVASKAANQPQLDVLIFNSNPSTSNTADKATLALSANDSNKVVGVVHISDWSSAGNTQIGQAQNLVMPYTISTGNTGFALVISRSTFTPASANDISTSFNVIRS